MRIAVLTALILPAFAIGAAAQQAGDWAWVQLDNAPAGSPSEILLDEARSNASDTFVQLVVHGFWQRLRHDPEGKAYTEIRVPGMGSTREIGAPRTPTIRFSIAIPEGVKANTQRNANWLQVSVTEEARHTQVVDSLWPRVIASTDQNAPDPQNVSTPEEFRIDSAIYAQDQAWPGNTPLRGAVSSSRLRSIESVEVELSPVRWNPGTRQLEVSRQLEVHLSHPIEPKSSSPISFDREKLAKLAFSNWTSVQEFFPIDRLRFRANYLIIYPDASYSDEVEPLVDQKRARGYGVTEMRVDEIGGTCEQIRSAIQTWEASVPIWRDAYVLLVGDTDVIPLCTSPTGVPTDDLYASTNGDDLDEEVYLGRLSINNEADLANQIAKILAYEDNPASFCCYHQAGLWAHKEGAPGKYEGAHETVRTNTYAVAPSFLTYYGSQAGVGDSDIVNEVDGGVGVLAYRGHGSSASTATSWNQVSDFFDGGDVGTLGNASPRTPVVWSFACSNSDLDLGGSCAGGDCGTTSSDDSIAEIWMEKPDSASVSYYGATVPSYTDENHILDEWMFLAVFDEALTKQSHAIKRAEAQTASLVGDDNAWMYLLLGDPDMDIRRSNPMNFEIMRPESLNPCVSQDCSLNFQVFDDDGNPVPNALVGLWKEGPTRESEGEVFINGYTNDQGIVNLEASPLTVGEIQFSVRVEGGISTQTTGVIPVVVPAVPASNVFGIALLLVSVIVSGLTALRFGPSPQSRG